MKRIQKTPCFKDYVGTRRYNWTVIEYIGHESYKSKKYKEYFHYWKCKCDCGAIKQFSQDILTRKNPPRNDLKCKKCKRPYWAIVSRINDPIPDKYKFEGNFIKSNGCWEWTGVKNSGYGQCIFNGFITQAHRVSYFLNKGNIPDGLMICHMCDNKGCVNPDHLYAGTSSDNQNDRWRPHRIRKEFKMKEKEKMHLEQAKNIIKSIKDRNKGLDESQNEIDLAYLVSVLTNKLEVWVPKEWEIFKNNYLKSFNIEV